MPATRAFAAACCVTRLAAVCVLALAGTLARAAADPDIDLPAQGAAIGAAARLERSPYRGGGVRYDFLPLYLYEGERGYLRPRSVGLKFAPAGPVRYELFLRRRFEGYPVERIPASLEGMQRREPGVDLGASVEHASSWGVAFAEVLRDIAATSHGSELRLGYRYAWRSGRWWVQPQAVLAIRNARLNDYYYGVRPEEERRERPAYRVGAGATPEAGIYAAYRLTARWQLLAGASIARLPDTAAASPVVSERWLPSVQLGALYDVSPQHGSWAAPRPLILRAFYGGSTDCDVLPIITLRCTSVHTQDKTDVAGIEVGRPFIERLNGWPLDLAGFIGLLRHHEKGFQPDFWQVNAYVKGYYYGFPWDARLRTRAGLGVGLSYARRVPLVEQREQAARGRGTSKLLNTFDPTFDVSVGDLVGQPRLRDTYAGVGVSHRSGIFGTSRLLGNVDGGSNYIYGYVETTF